MSWPVSQRGCCRAKGAHIKPIHHILGCNLTQILRREHMALPILAVIPIIHKQEQNTPVAVRILHGEFSLEAVRINQTVKMN